MGGCHRQAGGSINACHDYAAATIVDIGREEDLIEAMYKLVQAEILRK